MPALKSRFCFALALSIVAFGPPASATAATTAQAAAPGSAPSLKPATPTVHPVAPSHSGPPQGGASTTRSIMRPRDKAAMQFQEVATNLKAFKSACGHFPTTAQGFKALVEKPADLNCSSYPKGGFTKEAEPKDLWNHNLIYTSDGEHYKIMSLGADGKEGGEGVDMDAVVTD